MKYLLDTNVVSELRKRDADTNLVRWMQERSSTESAISVITVMELEIGVRRAERRDPGQGEILRRWLDERVLVAFAERILPVDLTVARCAAQLHVPDPQPERDCLIAATALTHGLAVVTRNGNDFSGTGVDVIDPWRTPR